jgi:23S rRNA (uridine2552-2'-O)-methyltransferase
VAKSTSSARWKQRQARDPFVRKAQAEGWRSRAIFKLSELQRIEKLMAPGSIVVDLGAAPGAWSQYAASIVGPRGRVVALDLLEMPPLPGVEVLQGEYINAVRARFESVRMRKPPASRAGNRETYLVARNFRL